MALVAPRNRSNQTDNEKTAHEVMNVRLASFIPEFTVFITKFTQLAGQ